MKYVKKPVVVEAFRYGYDPKPKWFNEDTVIEKMNGEGGFIRHRPKYERPKRPNFNKGKYIIKDVQGEIYPCTKDIFDASYEPIIGDYIKIPKDGDRAKGS